MRNVSSVSSQCPAVSRARVRVCVPPLRGAHTYTLSTTGNTPPSGWKGSRMTCPACLTRTTRDTHTLCDQCAWQVRRDLDDLPALAKEINTTLTKQARFDNGKSRPGKNRPLDLARDEDVDRFLRS